MADVLDLESLILDDIEDAPEFRHIPGGRLLVTVQEYKEIENTKNGNKGYELMFTVDDMVGGQDPTGVDVSRARIYHAFWFTQNSAKYVKDDIFKIAPDLKGQGLPLPQLIEGLVGRQVVVETHLEDYDARTKRKHKYPKLRIDEFETYA